jgi:DNA-directed RNA polymerase subunit alpha
MQHIQLPTTIEFQDSDMPHVGELLITPCQKGYGTTIGNSYRRVLLSSLPGAAVESVKIDGVQHEFSAIPGVKEDMIEVILNLKQLAVKCHTTEPVLLTLKKKEIGPVTGADFEKNADVEVMNTDHVLFHITDASKPIQMEITVGTGSGYVPVAEKETKHLPLGTIAIDSLYTPIRDVGYKVETTRVGDITDFEKVVLRVETNGTVSPKSAVAQATDILMDHFALVKESAQ